MRTPLLRVTGLTKRFGSTHAVRPLDLEIGGGEYFCILGPSGSGKSTLLRMIGGFETPDAGEIHLGGERIDHLPPEKRDANTVFQGYALFPHLSVKENVAFGLRMKRIAASEIDDRVGEALRHVGLGDYGARSPMTLSGGERQRVALARALVNRPRVLLLDEPLAALDRKLRLRMQEELARIQAEIGIAFIHVTHDQEEAFRLSDRLAVMNGGRFLQMGPPEEVYRRPRTPFVADFLGAANLLRGRTVDHAAAEVVLEGSGIVLRSGGDRPIPPTGGEAVYAVRPASFRVEEVPAEGGANTLAATVLASRPVGETEELRVNAEGIELTVHLPKGVVAAVPAVGERIRLRIDPADLLPLEEEDGEFGDG